MLIKFLTRYNKDIRKCLPQTVLSQSKYAFIIEVRSVIYLIMWNIYSKYLNFVFCYIKKKIQISENLIRPKLNLTNLFQQNYIVDI